MRSMEEDLLSYRTRVRASIISIVVGFLICCTKFVGYLTTGSYAILSDALESIINVAAALFATYSIIEGARKADRDHPYGRGRMEYFSAGFEGGLILLAGALILHQSVPRLFTGNRVAHIDLGLLFTGAGTIANALLALFLIQTAKKHHSLALEADGKHIMTDVISSVGLFFGLIVVAMTGIPWLDPLLACLMALWILWSGLQLVRQSFFQLMDRTSPRVTEQVTNGLIAARGPAMIRPHLLRLRESGPFVLVDFHMVVPRYYTVKELHALEDSIHGKLAEKLERPVDLLLHNDPCTSRDCGYCSMKRCPVRKRKQTSQLEWTSQSLAEDVLHSFKHDT